MGSNGHPGMKSQLPTRRAAIASMAGALALRADTRDWVNLFDGKTMKDWKASENAGTWRVTDGCLSSDGPRSHLFYAGPVQDAHFRNFELEVEVRSRPRCN